MYKSPIELLVTEIHNQIVEQQDEEVYKAVVHFIPHIDRAELLRALHYDRDQHDKGYADGKADADKALVRCGKCKHWRHETAETIDHYECDIFCDAYGRGYLTKADDFCSYGERKDGEG